MADINQIITLGIGTPADIKHFILVGLNSTGPVDNIHRIPAEEFFAWQRPVLAIQADPPSTVFKGLRYIVANSAATGAWVGHENDIAWYYESGWLFDEPVEGWYAYNQGDNILYLFDGSTWVNSGASVGSWLPLVDGSEPPVFITDGAGVLIAVAFNG